MTALRLAMEASPLTATAAFMICDQVFGERSYNTKSSAWQGIFAPTTDRQTRAIVADVVKQINPR